ncbi:hypothetical protein GCM10022238_22020 [Gordonia hankookensis]
MIASIGLRLTAVLIDVALFLAAFFVTGVVAIFVAAAFNDNIGYVWPIQLLVLFLLGVYNIGILQGTNGASLGKRIVHIEVVDDADGSHIGAGRGLLRLIVHVVDLIALIGLFIAAGDAAQHKSVADRVCKTVVVCA